MQDRDYEELKKFAYEHGASVFGVADISRIKNKFNISKDTLKKLDKAICIGVKLSKAILDEIKDHPTRLYFHHYRAANMFLDQLAFRITSFIQLKGYSALPIPASQILDWEKQIGHLSHKEIASLAGIGWIGRCNLLIHKELGAQIRLATILTNLPLKADLPANDDCGDCRSCIPACPAGAIKEDKEDFDHIACFEKLKEFRKKRFVDQFICGVCAKFCAGQKA